MRKWVSVVFSAFLLYGPACETARDDSQRAVAQIVRDSAGIRITENVRPTWSAAEALRLSASPALVIGTRAEPSYELSRVAGTARFADGRIVIADGGSFQLRFFDSSGTFINFVGRRGEGPGEFTEMRMFERLPGDTLALLSGEGTISVFTGNGEFIRRASALPPPGPTTGIRVIVAIMSGQSAVIASLPNQARRPPATRWVDSVGLVLVKRDTTVRQSLGNFPAMLMEIDEPTPRPPWFGPHVVFATDGTSFYVGYGGDYSIRVYSPSGRLERVIRRRWTPVRVTRRDIDNFVTEWSKRWIRSTGAEAEKEKQDLRDDPYAAEVPAFSQFILDRSGRLWVREAHVADAAGAGQLTTSPLVPSVWSVFDREGHWLGDVTMPARFLPRDIGADYVLGVARDDDGVETVVRYRMGSGTQFK